MIAEENVDLRKCIRCGKDKGFNASRNASLKLCIKCARHIKDEEYLDEGSEVDIRENIDRPKQVRCDYNEMETELDKLLEEY